MGTFALHQISATSSWETASIEARLLYPGNNSAGGGSAHHAAGEGSQPEQPKGHHPNTAREEEHSAEAPRVSPRHVQSARPAAEQEGAQEHDRSGTPHLAPLRGSCVRISCHSSSLYCELTAVPRSRPLTCWAARMNTRLASL